jgi:two-component system response regulator CpxR
LNRLSILPTLPLQLIRRGDDACTAIAGGAILFITDDERLGRLVAQALDCLGFSLSCESDVDRGITTSARGGYCLVLVDAAADGVAFPRLTLDICHRSSIPLIIISADRDPANAARLLENGADDCIGRPVEPDELIARVRAVLRRARRPFDTPHQPIEVGNIRIDPQARVVTVDSTVIHCTSIEYDILEYLARRAGKVISRQELVLAVCGRDASPLDRSLDVHISHLKRKLRQYGKQIVTVRGVGYMLAMTGMPGDRYSRTL